MLYWNYCIQRKIFIISSTVFISSSLAFALPFEEDRPLYSGSRPLAMGNAFIAIADDANAGFWNPAGLIQSQGVKISLSTQVSKRKTNAFDSKCVGYCYREIGLFWGNKIALRVEDDNIPDYNYYSVAYKLNSYIAMGSSVKFKRRHPCNYYQFFGYKAGYDLGILCKPSVHSLFGLLVQDLSDKKGLINIISIGSSNRILKQILLSSDISFIFHDNFKLETHLGSEIDIYEWLKFRLGITDRYPTFGIGISLYGIKIDYACIRDVRGNISYISSQVTL